MNNLYILILATVGVLITNFILSKEINDLKELSWPENKDKMIKKYIILFSKGTVILFIFALILKNFS